VKIVISGPAWEWVVVVTTSTFVSTFIWEFVKLTFSEVNRRLKKDARALHQEQRGDGYL
jgi:hypothetical protein